MLLKHCIRAQCKDEGVIQEQCQLTDEEICGFRQELTFTRTKSSAAASIAAQILQVASDVDSRSVFTPGVHVLV